jgi:hypothetical protein
MGYLNSIYNRRKNIISVGDIIVWDNPLLREIKSTIYVINSFWFNGNKTGQKKIDLREISAKDSLNWTVGVTEKYDLKREVGLPLSHHIKKVF